MSLPFAQPSELREDKTALNLLVAALEKHGSEILNYENPSSNEKYLAHCPAHEDTKASLVIFDHPSWVGIYCRALCETDDVLKELGLTKADLFSDDYRYSDGRVVHRRYDSDGRKTFPQSGNRKGGGVLYLAETIEQAVAAGKTIHVCEGEKDVKVLVSLGYVATTAPGGAGGIKKVDIEMLRGADVVAHPDQDSAGEKWAASLQQRLDGVAASLEFRGVKAGKDVTDHIEAGFSVEDMPLLSTVPEAIDIALDVSNPLETADFLRDNIGTGRLSGFFRRGSELVRTPSIGEDGYVAPKAGQDDGPAQVQPVDPHMLAAQMSYLYRPFVVKSKGSGENKQVYNEPCLFPFPPAQTAVKAIDQMRSLRTLKGVTHTPLVRPDGTILTQPGYDAATSLLYLPDPDLKVAEVSDAPSEEEIARAVSLLTDIVADFPFVTEHDKMNYLGLLITPVLRGLCPPPYKMGAMTAPSPGSGKTLLADIMRAVHGGVFRSEMPGDEPELKKSISAILDVTTSPVVHFDNLTGVLKSSALAGLLTSNVWTDRRLGSTTNVDTPNDRLWIVTGNNLAIGADLPRRTITVTIDPKMPNPHLRTGCFTIDPLLPWVTEHRGELLWAMLTLVRSWHVAGRPVRGKRSSDVFGPWIEAVDGILSHAGIDGQFDSGETQIEVGAGDDEWGEFLAAVYEVMGDAPWMAKDVLSKVRTYGDNQLKPITIDKLPTALSEKLRGHNDNMMALTKSLGWWLKNHAGRYAGYNGDQYTARVAGGDKNGKTWAIEKG